MSKAIAQSDSETGSKKTALEIGDTVICNEYLNKSAEWDTHANFKGTVIWKNDTGEAIIEVTYSNYNRNAPKKGSEVMVLDEWVFSDSKKWRVE